MSARLLLLTVCLATTGSAIAGCAEDSRLRYADDTAQLSASAITEVETSGGEDPELAPLLARAHVRLHEIEHSIDLWRDHGGPMSYRTHAPCLRNALIALRDALNARGLPVPADLDSADAMLGEVASHECAP